MPIDESTLGKIDDLVAEGLKKLPSVRRELARRARAIRAALAARPRRHHEAGVLLDAVIRERFHRTGGSARFGEFASKQVGIGRTQAWKLIRVARAYGEADVAAIGFEKAAVLIEYARAVRTNPARLVARDAKVDGRPLSECSVRDLRAATRARTGTAGDTELVERVAAWLVAEGIADATVTAHGRGVRIDLTGGSAEVLASPKASRRRRGPAESA